MKTKQEQIEKMASIIAETLQHKRVENGAVFVTYLPSILGNADREKEVAEALIENGYSDISGYKAEIERLKAENERFENNMKNVLKIEKRQAQIDVLKELKTRHDYAIKNMGYPWDISQQIDELIEEVEQ